MCYPNHNSPHIVTKLIFIICQINYKTNYITKYRYILNLTNKQILMALNNYHASKTNVFDISITLTGLISANSMM